MRPTLAFIGFGEAGAAFAGLPQARGYDLKLADPALRAAKLRDFADAGVAACTNVPEALTGAGTVISVVTADQTLAVARECAPFLARGALWLDMNSVAPETKRAAAALIEAAARYVDVAVMAPVHPLRRHVPLLAGGPHAEAAAEALHSLGFIDVRAIGGEIGSASAIKMIRSVMVKGIEALSAECALAAQAAGVCGEVIASLDASWPGADWTRRFDYNLDRMIVHGRRRADEMDEAVKTLDALGTDAAMSRATAQRQRALGNLAMTPPAGLGMPPAWLGTPPARLGAKLAALLPLLAHPPVSEAA